MKRRGFIASLLALPAVVKAGLPAEIEAPAVPLVEPLSFGTMRYVKEFGGIICVTANGTYYCRTDAHELEKL